ncbi:MAG: ABC transporter ATP-binding protein [Planctomycetota bacterium]
MADSSNFSAFWRLVKPHAGPRLPWLAAAMLLTLVGGGGVALAILLIRPLLPILVPSMAPEELDRLGPAGPDWVTIQVEALSDWMVASFSIDGGDGRMATVWAIAAILLAIGAVSSVATYAAIVISRWVGLKLVVDLRLQLARHLMGLSVRYHSSREFGDLLSRISADVQQTLAAIDLALKELVREPGQGLMFLGVAVYSAPKLSLAVAIALPLMAIPVALFAKRVRKGSTKSLTSLGASVQALSQMFTGVRTVKAFRAEERELARYHALNEGYLTNALKMVRAVALSQSWTVFVSMLGFALILVGIGYVSVTTDVFSDDPSKLIVFILCVAQAYSKLKRSTNAITRVQESMGAATRLNAILDEPVDLVESPHPVPLTSLGDGVRLDGLSFRYPDSDVEALSAVDLEVRPGEKLAIVGPSGSGKSTLIDLLARFVDPTVGRVTIGGVDLRDASIDDWTALYAMVGQVPFLFHTTVLENIRYGKPDATDAEVEAAARAAHIHDFIVGLPEGYQTDVADAGARLSGGQRQRIAIARAVLKGAPLLLLDEATSALDSESEVAVQQALDELMEGRTVVVVAHRLSTIRNADRIAVFEAGRLVELGSHAELVERKGVYARLHTIQAGTGVS